MYFQNDTFTSVPETLVSKSVILRCQMAFRQTNELEIDFSYQIFEPYIGMNNQSHILHVGC